MTRFLNITIYAIMTLLLCTGCSRQATVPHEHSHALQVLETTFAPDYKTFSVKVKVPKSISSYSITDSSRIHFTTEEKAFNYTDNSEDMQPVLSHVRNIRQQELADSHLSLLLLVDLTMDEAAVQREHDAIQLMRRWFAPSNLHIAFMTNGNVSSAMPLTDYVMDNYFKAGGSGALLYRSILQKQEEIAGWKHLQPRQKGLIVFSDGNVYNKNMPIDHDHYALQEQLLHTTASGGYSPVGYINVGEDYEDGEGNEAKLIMQQLVRNTKGIYLDAFDWSTLLSHMLETFNIGYADYQLDFVNPDDKVYVGKTRHLTISVYDGQRLLAQGCAEYNIGSIYSPVIVNGESTVQLVLQGILLALLCILVAYLLMQFLIPYVSYRIFKRRYITRYTNTNMIYRGIQVSQSCYYCKAPFEEGDEIVVKCHHVLHRDCWEENEYKCPEYGRHCKDGAHYYNRRNLFDRRNAPYYAVWVIAAIVAGLLAWILFNMLSERPSAVLLNKIMLSIHDLQPGTTAAQEAYDRYAKHLNVMPVFGLSINLCLTFILSFLCQPQPLRVKLQWCAAKAFIAAFCGYFIFLLVCIVSIILDIEDDVLLIDWTPWILNAFIITAISTIYTRVRMRTKYIAASGAVAVVIMYVWDGLFFDSSTDNRLLLLLCFLVYAIALAVSIAIAAPRSERYFLHVEGAMKPIDVALYKWMRTSPDYKVTIGKSVDCSLQMTWDFSPLAPVHAIISQYRGNIYLTALEDGVTDGTRPLPVNKRIRLYHGKHFTIGQTTFTYIEKDS